MDLVQRIEMQTQLLIVDAGFVQQLLPQITVQDGRASLAPAAEQALRSEEHRRINQYAWEGAFFLLALGVCITVIARALSAEAHHGVDQQTI